MKLLTTCYLALALGTPAVAEATAIQRAELSAQLFALGIEAADATLVLSAAKVRRGLDLQGPADGAPPGWDDMLATARALAEGDDALLALIDDAEVEGARGVATGQVYSISEIGDGGTDTYDPLPFQGGEYAEVYVESQDGSDLNLFVYDAAGRLVCSDTDISAISYCGWRPAELGAFTIEVVNRGTGGAGYALMTN